MQWQGKIVRRIGRIHKTNLLFFDPKWFSDEGAEEKNQRLLKFFDDNVQTNATLIAASAGGAISMPLFSSRTGKIDSLKLISPKLLNPNNISDKYLAKSRSLTDISKNSEQIAANLSATQLKKLAIYKPLVDLVVPPEDMLLPKAKITTTPLLGHGASIAVTMIYLLNKSAILP